MIIQGMYSEQMYQLMENITFSIVKTQLKMWMNEKMAYRKLKLFSSLNTKKALSEWSPTNCYIVLKEICYTLYMFIKKKS